jgi:hypothetical protein
VWLLCSMFQLLVNANVVPSSPILVTLMMEALHSSKIQVHTRATQHTIQEDGIFHSHRRENLNSFKSISISVTGCRGLQVCEMLRILQCLHSRLTDDREVATHMH